MDMIQGVLNAAVHKLQDIPNHMEPMTVEEIEHEIDTIVGKFDLLEEANRGRC